MNSFDSILDKLNAFTKKFYTTLLLKGLFLFLTLGLLFFLIITAIEYFLWMGSTGRLSLLMAFITIELILLYRYILVPLFYLFKVKKGISHKEASVIIGKHFPEVGDKLVNLLDLKGNTQQSDLLEAAISQRSEKMRSVPFVKAVDYKQNLKYVKYTLVPILIFGLIWIFGNSAEFFGSYKRVVNYDLAYEPPAPFSFILLNEDLSILENEALTIELRTEGSVKPENVSIVIDGKELLMQAQGAKFQHTFRPPLKSTSFYFTSNGYDSRTYKIVVGNVPAIQGFEMQLQYPAYLGKRNETVSGTGNATVPEGTKVSWSVKGVHTNAINFETKDTIVSFGRSGDKFSYGKRIYNELSYAITTSNENIEEFERLGYQLKVVKDGYPSVKVEQTLDSLNPNVSYYAGLANDDIRLRSIDLVYYPENEEKSSRRLRLLNSKVNVEQFYYTFPSGLELEKGKEYELYFEVFDNDGLRNGKSVKSKVFRTTVLDYNQLKNKELNAQKSILKNLDKSLETFKEQQEALKKINDKQKQNEGINYNEQSQIKEFLQKQEQQEEMMQKFSKQLKENLNKNETDDKLNRLLQERLERQEKEAEKNRKLLEELNMVADKIDKEDLKKKLEELSKKQSNSKRNLEQLLELTKRYYVTEKVAQLAQDLDKLAKEQEQLSKSELGVDFSKEEQQKLNEKFEELAEEINEVKRDNADLKKPLAIEASKKKQEGVKKDQKEALDEIDKQQQMEESGSEEQKKQASKKTSQKQKSAAQKLKELSEGLQQSAAMSGGGSSITEDAEMLRQILDNLVTFSFKQENLFDELQVSDGEISQFSNTVKRQKELRGLFEHVDDSLFALSLRRAELSEFVNEQITEVYYNIDKSLGSIAENQVYQGASYQQYVLTAANSLADFLADLLDNMQQSMQSGQGQGQGEGFQLPDIIKGQQSLKEKLEGAGKEGTKGQQEGEGKEGQQGKSGEGKEGKSGKSDAGGNEDGKGNQGKEGAEGNGKKGKKGDGNDDGEGNESGKAPSEQELKELYEIYKEQQVIRQKLEEQLKNIIEKDKRDLAKKLVRQMENFENDLIENGITQRTKDKVNRIQQQLLKLENAVLKQGQKQERKSQVNQEEFRNPITTKPALLKEEKNTIEILNRQALPLRKNYQGKVQSYFKNDGGF
ncbi:hypothetical protein MTsPCn5_32740 [Croceitalea sp. MTPC5]|uniref:hypothetical protein n=1 Tax=Croceitalea sp. MTPC5 TaxID=3056565 RepID=UPI002B36D470|nr:hypothetical protein MTsPCn5_32740 [Croceitalea sp. MTPC5]